MITYWNISKAPDEQGLPMIEMTKNSTPRSFLFSDMFITEDGIYRAIGTPTLFDIDFYKQSNGIYAKFPKEKYKTYKLLVNPFTPVQPFIRMMMEIQQSLKHPNAFVIIKSMAVADYTEYLKDKYNNTESPFIMGAILVGPKYVIRTTYREIPFPGAHERLEAYHKYEFNVGYYKYK